MSDDDTSRPARDDEPASGVLAGLPIRSPWRLLPIGLVALVVGLASSWQFESVRLAVLDHVGPLAPELYGHALDDQSASVRAHACGTLIRQGDVYRSVSLQSRLIEEPSEALQCLQRAEHLAQLDDTSKVDPIQVGGEEVTLLPPYRAVGYQLGEAWFRQLMTRDTENRIDQCPLADKLAPAFSYVEVEAEHRLATCALLSPSAEARQCCLEAFGGREALQRLFDTPEAYSTFLTRRFLGDFVGMAFGFSDRDDSRPSRGSGGAEPAADGPSDPSSSPSVDAGSDSTRSSADAGTPSDRDVGGETSPSSNEEATPKDEADRTTTLVSQTFQSRRVDTTSDVTHTVSELVVSLEPERLQDWVLEIGCRATASKRRELARAFLPLLSSSACMESPPATFVSKVAWDAVCASAYEQHRRAGFQPEKAICRSLQQYHVALMIGRARARVDHGLERGEWESQQAKDSTEFVSTDSSPDPAVPGWYRRRRAGSGTSNQMLGNFLDSMMGLGGR